MKIQLYPIVLAAIVLTGCTAPSILTTGIARSAGLTPPEEVVEMGGKRFFCDYYNHSQNGWIKEYVPHGQTVTNWEELVGVRYFRTLESPEKYILSMADQYSREYPHMKFAILKNTETGHWIVDYIAYTKGKNGVVEWNYFQAEKANNGTGIIVNQYARRFASFSDLEKMNFADRRPEILAMLTKSDFEAQAVSTK